MSLYQSHCIRWLNMSKAREKQDKFRTKTPTSNMLSSLFNMDYMKSIFTGNPYELRNDNQNTNGRSDYFLSEKQRSNKPSSGQSSVASVANKKSNPIRQSGLASLNGPPNLTSKPSNDSAVVGRSAKRNSKSVVPTCSNSEASPMTSEIVYSSGLKGGNNAASSSNSSSGGGISASRKLSGSSVIFPIISPTAAVTSSSIAAGSTNNASKPAVLCCDKCDGKHETASCPYYKKQRDAHPDAQKNKQIGGHSSLPGSVIASSKARIVAQPGDGSCLFHSMSYGLRQAGSSTVASALRAEICRFISANPTLRISDTPLQDWVRWDSGNSVGEYARNMSRGSWGGGIEMACLSQLRGCNVHVYEQQRGGFKRISAFDHPVSPESKPVIKVLYRGGVHYGEYSHNLLY